MQWSYFGLIDNPFSIAPNPHYLFMSDRHQEALSHLRYGLTQSGGFVMLTGEVGTGKTTVSRKLLQELESSTEVAFILNPTLSALELLAAVCDELSIPYDHQVVSLKVLTDCILRRLADNYAAGIQTVLVIDEAQHLLPEVLEQLRLLTNLETNTEKLLKIILIGQPELQQLLERNELRQLAQRITARYHLLSLNREELAQYITHRLQVAGGAPGIMPKSVVDGIYQLTSGTPRLTNLLCERALAIAFSRQKSAVSNFDVWVAGQQVMGIKSCVKWQQRRWRWYYLAATVTGLAVGLTLGMMLNDGVLMI